ncbi:FadR/GntR family transcriptional regulator [Sedimentitalea nanhaiensis]|uniref:Transcriptional regulator, GntR family n=1 Tax=Sedimentitalea nanhaiensis TaxID=999627 RepID=A0A1I7BIL8_9RHOB|nr:FadR/GntR family transcriptional regulator [Sedimentitalea nanhaiensis]SFT87015.1 transcriptional regulator, GntR family [Sedimentitalea nanhaiensis]
MTSRLYPTGAIHARIAHEIGRRIAGGELAEGQMLPKESELQTEFSASRQAVREALKVLGAKGMIHARKRAGTFVRARSFWNMLDPDVLAWHPSHAVPDQVLRELVELRVMVEPLAASLAAGRADDAQICRIEAALTRMGTGLDDPGRFYEADIDFHLAIFAASGNSLVDRLSTIISPLLEASFRQQRKAHGSLNEGYLHHAAVLDAIKRSDAHGAEAAMRLILDRAKAEMSLKAPGAN